MDAIVDPNELDYRLSPSVSTIKDGRAVGYARLWKEYDIKAPLRYVEAIAGGRISGNEREVEGVLWRSNRAWPGDTLYDHLEYAMRRERLDLLLLKKLFLKLPASDLEGLTEAIRGKTTAANARRIWFLYEWLTGREMEIPDQKVGNYDFVLDPAAYYGNGVPTTSRRHRLHDNLPGTAEFCAITRKTDFLDLAAGFRSRVNSMVDTVAPDLRRRAAAHMILKDSKASFEIEGETPSSGDERVRRWAKTIGRAGARPLDVDYLVQLQQDVIGDNQFVHLGMRTEGVFIGDRDRDGTPIPEFIGARPADLPSLVNGLMTANSKMMGDGGFNPAAHAAAVAFGFVYVHPFEDGNGRVHRYLLQHVLAERKVSPAGMVFPVATAILDRIEDYAAVLKRHSLPLMEYIPWKQTGNGNVEIVADTADYYRYPDVTEQATFLAECIERTVDHDMPAEINYLKGFDQAIKALDNIVSMPRPKATLLIHLIQQNGGTLSKKKRKAEFGNLDNELLLQVEKAVQESFDFTEEIAQTPL